MFKIKNKKILTLTIIEIILFIIIIVSLIYIIKWFKNNEETKITLNKIANSITIINNEQIKDINDSKDDKIVNKYKVNFNKLKDENADTIAWLKVNGTNIEYPVVKGEDNSYYLIHSFNRNYNSAGWIFADYTNKFDGTDKNIIIYGHNRKDGSMFYSLKNILNKEWYENKENQEIMLLTENENIIYLIFSVYQVEKEDYYITTNFNNKNEFLEYIYIVKNRSLYNFNVDVDENDTLLTLSTCGNNNNYRIVLHAKKL